jgi:hypothetical protein
VQKRALISARENKFYRVKKLPHRAPKTGLRPKSRPAHAIHDTDQPSALMAWKCLYVHVVLVLLSFQ